MSGQDAQFKDHFSGHARAYAAHRPAYPDSLFEWLASEAPGRALAWDCATGNGQAAIALAGHFRRVYASDASAQQLSQAPAHPGVRYAVERAEHSSLESASVDLVTVAQAWHWLDHAAFNREAERVLRPGGVLAVWTYPLVQVETAVDAVVGRLYEDVLGPWWPPERAIVDGGYATFDPGWPALQAPEFEIAIEWSLDEFLAYLNTWSAAQRYRRDRGTDPVEEIRPEFANAWGGSDTRRTAYWPLIVKAFRKPRDAASTN